MKSQFRKDPTSWVNSNYDCKFLQLPVECGAQPISELLNICCFSAAQLQTDLAKKHARHIKKAQNFKILEMKR